jgi:hypothetical protein
MLLLLLTFCLLPLFSDDLGKMYTVVSLVFFLGAVVFCRGFAPLASLVSIEVAMGWYVTLMLSPHVYTDQRLIVENGTPLPIAIVCDVVAHVAAPVTMYCMTMAKTDKVFTAENAVKAWGCRQLFLICSSGSLTDPSLLCSVYFSSVDACRARNIMPFAFKFTDFFEFFIIACQMPKRARAPQTSGGGSLSKGSPQS